MNRSILTRTGLIRSFAAVENEGGNEPENEQDPQEGAEEAEEGSDDDDKDDEDSEEWDRDRAMSKIKKANAEARAQRERAKAAEDKAAGADEAGARADKAEARALKLEVGYDLGLPKSLALRLQGTTTEELTKDAETLLREISPRGGGRKPKDPLRSDNPTPTGGDTDLSAEEIVKRATQR